VILVLVIVVVVVLMILAALPRGRENARIVGCQENLRQIGVALALYSQPRGNLPRVPELGTSSSPDQASPLGAMLEELGLSDFSRLRDPKKALVRQPGALTGERPVAGFVCPSDALATPGRFPAPVSYRASTGDTPSGETGAFAPGKQVLLTDIEAADGLAYTAAFSERLVGAGDPVSNPRNYALMPGPIGREGCAQATNGGVSWRGDAGKSWVTPDWVSTLYTHAQPPSAAMSCIAQDGHSAMMGVSSGHANRIHVLMLDGGVRPYTTHVDGKVWRALANINDTARKATPSAASPAKGPVAPQGKQDDR
jgi:hypothetical protein